MSSNEPEKVRSLHIGIRTQSEFFVSLKLMILNLLVVELNTGYLQYACQVRAGDGLGVLLQSLILWLPQEACFPLS